MIEQIIIIYLVVINLVAFAAYGIDKWKAQHNRWRIPEATLIMLAVIGGALGAFLGMKMFRHKTQHWKFRILVPLLLVLWIVAIAYFVMKFT
jgi:uncharacterized membrane protein YsdA (DUF1294 family)